MKIPTYKRLTNQWKSPNYNISFGPSKEEEILAIENKYNLKFPKNFREYLLKAIPKPHGGEMDENYASWWSLERIRSEGVEGRNAIADYLIFADHCISCWEWAICCKIGGNYGRIIWTNGDFVADNFSEFVDRYIKNSPDFIGAPDKN